MNDAAPQAMSAFALREAAWRAHRRRIGEACIALGIISVITAATGLPIVFGLVLGSNLPRPFDWFMLVASGSIGLALLMPALALGVLSLRLEGPRSQPYAISGIALAIIGAAGSVWLWIA